LSSDPVKGTFKSPLFYTFKLFSANCTGRSVDTYVDCDTFNTAQYKGIPYLDVTTVYSAENKTIFINVINRHQDKAITANIVSHAGKFSGNAEASVINSNDLKGAFTFDKQGQYHPTMQNIRMANNQLTYSFPPHSFTQIKVTVAGN
ncbi:MAG TPA: alpha-L-arabinofuranosidase C-terminal domain-containing protein, partial [Agriterribacter sp.]|nr:alpha-L-arabinofuranosidase C-terminal domain-containing protein [Agriterribacter sp.]